LGALRASKVPQTVHGGLGCGIAKAPIPGALQKVPDVADDTEGPVDLFVHARRKWDGRPLPLTLSGRGIE